jgi:putative nucleotidyltransferase with HDIG domain
LLEQLQTLPLHQTTALRVLELLDDPNVGINQLASLVATDPSLAARVLKLANSAFFARRHNIDTVDRAVMVVGLQTVRTLTLAAAFDLFDAKGGPLPANFWSHSLACASAATALARQLGVPANTAMCAGLLHDVGQALLVRLVPTSAAALDKAVDEDARRELERELVGVDHVEAAVLALTAARFPRALVEAVGGHHDDVAVRRASLDLAQLVAVADRLTVTTDASGVSEVLHEVGLVQVDAHRLVDEAGSSSATALIAA